MQKRVALFVVFVAVLIVARSASAATVDQVRAEALALSSRLNASQATDESRAYASSTPLVLHRISRTLAFGSTGEDVQALQDFLILSGYSVRSTGFFGPKTRAALEAFESLHGISPADGTLGTTSENAVNSHILTMTIVASSSPDLFSYPHGVIKVGNTMVIGTVKENPGQIIAFPDPGDLSHVIATTTPGFKDLADVDYDASHNKLYFVASRIDNGDLEILSVDPTTLSWTPVFMFDTGGTVGYSTIATDGSYVYVATQSVPAYLIKVRIADWSLAGMRSFPDLAGFHSSALDPRTGIWYVNTFSIPTTVLKVNTSDLSSSSVTPPKSGAATNDALFAPDSSGGALFITSEAQYGIDTIRGVDLSDTHYNTPGSYGLFSDGTDLFSMDFRDKLIIRYPHFDVSDPTFILTPGQSVSPNEWFPGLNGADYFTEFKDPSALYEYTAATST